jgi:hypothetical protein
MKAAPYSLEALRQYRKRHVFKPGPIELADIPPDAPMKEGIALGCWNGASFVSWEKWLASRPAEAFRVSPEDDHDRAR